MEVLKTQSLVLRPFKLTDLPAYYNFSKNALVGPPAGWEPHKNIHESKVILSRLIFENDVWAITIDDVLIGTINLTYVKQEGQYETGFSLSPSFWGLGIASEALNAVLKYAFTQLKIKEINAKHYYDNYRSKGVLVKAGFKKHKISLEKDIYENEQLVVEYKLKAKNYFKGVNKK